MDGVAALVHEYQVALEAASANRWNARVHNRHIDRACALFARLRLAAEGRDALTRLLGHADLDVRSWIASQCLEWAPDAASAVLREIEISGSPLQRLSAKTVLGQFADGTLKPCGLVLDRRK